MFKKYDTVIVKKTGSKATIVEIDDDGGRKPPSYLVEIIDKPDDADYGELLLCISACRAYRP